ncbi:unnamed protein product [Caenorhabditis sp. 36 PRJEB53466]|nr:unnamed protein product [Caenorhabditis sp. 36 PRJEB53466]
MIHKLTLLSLFVLVAIAVVSGDETSTAIAKTTKNLVTEKDVNGTVTSIEPTFEERPEGNRGEAEENPANITEGPADGANSQDWTHLAMGAMAIVFIRMM